MACLQFFPQQYLILTVGVSSALEIIVRARLQIIKSVAMIAVAFVIKLPADLESIKFSWETPIPRAPPSDFCNKTKRTKITASMMLITNNKVSMGD